MKAVVRASGVLAIAAAVACGGGQTASINPQAPSPVATPAPSPPPSGGGAASPQSLLPANLALPIALDQVTLRGVINPFGIVRSSLDQGATGHPGIDWPMVQGAPLFAPADGRIVAIEPQPDGLPGQLVKLLLVAGSESGTGWIVIFEHVTLLPGLGMDATVARGQQFATNPLDGAFTNHIELNWAFNGFRFHSEQTCWPDRLAASDQATLLDRFNNTFRTDARFVSAWQTVTMEGRFPFRGLLDTARFPDGPRLCYPKGTDVR